MRSARPTRSTTSPEHPYTKFLLGAALEADPDSPMHNEVLAGEPPSPMNPPSGCRFRTRCPYATQKCADEEPHLVELEPATKWPATTLDVKPLPRRDAPAATTERDGRSSRRYAFTPPRRSRCQRRRFGGTPPAPALGLERTRVSLPSSTTSVSSACLCVATSVAYSAHAACASVSGVNSPYSMEPM